MKRYRKQLQTAIRAALAAGEHFSAAVSNTKQVHTKSSPTDLVTEYDPQCEEIIRGIIQEAFPQHVILGEESTAPGSEASHEAAKLVFEEDNLWIVDPIDGTTNFVYELPLSVVSIGYAQNGRLQVGVIYDPYRDEVFASATDETVVRMSGKEAHLWLDESVEETDEAEDELPGVNLQVLSRTAVRGAVLATGFPPRASSRVLATEAALKLSQHVKSLRALGAAALHLAYVAAGRLDGFWEYDLNSWDLAAGVFLISQAGGTVRDLNGRDYNLLVRDIVATATPELAEDIIQRVVVPTPEQHKS